MNNTTGLVFALPLMVFPAIAEAADLMGVWARNDGKARVRVERCGSDICATNIWVKPGIRNEKVGDKLIMDIEPISQSRYEGKARDVRREMTYSMEVFVDGAKMRTRGCVLGKLICKSAHWTSVN